jgi:hypothetical protein
VSSSASGESVTREGFSKEQPFDASVLNRTYIMHRQREVSLEAYQYRPDEARPIPPGPRLYGLLRLLLDAVSVLTPVPLWNKIRIANMI